MKKSKVFKGLMALLISALVLHISIPAMAGSNASSLVEQQGLKAYNSKDYAKAKKDFQKACDGGVVKGCNNLGLLYDNGQGVRLNYTKAAQLYQKACDGGYIEGCDNLGVLYGYGWGVKQNHTKAAQLHKKACDGGYIEGCNNLGDSYADGWGVKQNHTKAAQLYQKACDGGYIEGCENLGDLYDNGQGVRQNYTKAAQLYQKACDGGYIEGCDNLGDLYKYGKGVRQNYTKAVQLYKKACDDSGSADGCREYKIMISAPLWFIAFQNYLGGSACHLSSMNGSIIANCGSFTLYYNKSSVKNFRIKSNFSSSINSQIAMIAQKKGIEVSNGFNFIPAFISYIISKTPQAYWRFWERKYSDKVVLVSTAIGNLISSGNIRVLNNIIKPFVREKLK